MSILIDSNILVFAINQDSHKHEAAQIFLQTHSAQLIVAHQNILESFRVLTHPKFSTPMTAADALEALNNIISVALVITPNAKTYAVWQELMQKYAVKSDAIFDCYLAATALSAGVMTIATDNTKDFQKYEEIKILNPFQSVK